MAASPSTSESIVPWELPIVVSNEFLVDCLGVSLSGPSNVQCVQVQARMCYQRLCSISCALGDTNRFEVCLCIGSM